MAEKAVRVLVDIKLNTSQSAAWEQRKSTASWASLGRLREGMFALCSALLRHIWSGVSSSGLLDTRHVWTLERVQQRAVRIVRGLKVIQREFERSGTV